MALTLISGPRQRKIEQLEDTDIVPKKAFKPAGASPNNSCHGILGKAMRIILRVLWSELSIDEIQPTT